MTNEPAPSAPLPAAAIEALRRGNKIEAIKLVCLERGIGLKDSKDAVETYLRGQPVLQQRLREAQAQGLEGLHRWFALGLLLLFAVVTYLYFSKS